MCTKKKEKKKTSPPLTNQNTPYCIKQSPQITETITKVINNYSLPLSLSVIFSPSLSHICTHTHTHIS